MTISTQLTSRNAFMKEHGIPPSLGSTLDTLGGGQIAICFDDSYSMKEKIASSYLDNGQPIQRERREEAYLHGKMIATLSAIYDDNGVDCYCLNTSKNSSAPHFRLVRDGSTMKSEDEVPLYTVSSQEFQTEALKLRGMTPLVATLQKIVGAWEKFLKTETSLTLFVLTDGQDSEGKDLSAWVQETFSDANIREKLHLTFVTVTDDKNLLQYFRKAIDEAKIPGCSEEQLHIDVVGSYAYEKECFAKANRGKEDKFTQGLYLAKMLAGSWDKKVDNMDLEEIKLSTDGGVVTETIEDEEMKKRLNKQKTVEATCSCSIM